MILIDSMRDMIAIDIKNILSNSQHQTRKYSRTLKKWTLNI